MACIQNRDYPQTPSKSDLPKPPYKINRKEAIFLISLALFAAVAVLVLCPYMQSDINAGVKIVSYISGICLTMSLLLLCCRFRTIGVVALPVLVMVNLASFFTYFSVRQYYNAEIFAKIMETNVHEAAPYMTPLNIAITLILFVSISLFPFVGHKLMRPKTNYLFMAGTFVLCLITTATAYGILPDESQDQNKERATLVAMRSIAMWPLYEAYCTCKYIKQYSNDYLVFKNLSRMPSGYVEAGAQDKAARPEDIIVVLMVGESVRADHLPANGYERDTTPELTKRGDRLISFPRTCSFGLVTTTSTFGLLTDAEMANRTSYHSSFLNLLTEDGVESFACLDVNATQFDYFLNDKITRYGIPCEAGEQHVFSPTVDIFGKIVKERTPGKRTFILCNDTGAHCEFASKQHNRRFLPADPSLSSGLSHLQEYINAYDNCLLEISWEIDALIRSLESEHRPAVFIYVSDHGELLGEHNKLAHAVPVKEVCSPAFFIWCSDEFVAQYPEQYEALRHNVSKAVSHDHVMHTVLSLLGYRRGTYKPGLDLTRKDAVETPIPANIGTLNGQKLGN